MSKRIDPVAFITVMLVVFGLFFASVLTGSGFPEPKYDWREAARERHQQRMVGQKYSVPKDGKWHRCPRAGGKAQWVGTGWLYDDGMFSSPVFIPTGGDR